MRIVRDDLEKYRVPEARMPNFWRNTWVYGGGYDVMSQAGKQGYKAVARWAKDGYDLGAWPYVIIFTCNRTSENVYDVVLYVEGTITMHTTPTRKLRNEIIDHYAFYWWKRQGEEQVKQYATVDEMPPALRGPYGRRKAQVEAEAK